MSDPRIALVAEGPMLPCKQSCPPAANTCAALQACLLGWLGDAQPGNKTVLCLPAQSTGAWLVSALLPATHALCVGLECNPAAEAGLAILPKALRVKRKSAPEYRRHVAVIDTNWAAVTALCSQAGVFEQAVVAVLP